MNKIKNYIFMIGIIYSISIIFLMINSYINSNKKIELHDNVENKALIEEYKKELISIKNVACRDAIEKLIINYENTSYDGMVDLKTIVLSETPISYFSSINKECNLNKDEALREKVSISILTSSIQLDEIIQDYIYQYELRLPDSFNRSLTKPSLTNIEYNINRKYQLDAIKNVILIAKDGDNNE